MPELPEVETIRRGLHKVIVGKTITGFESRDTKVVRFDEKEIEGMRVESIERRAKILVIALTSSSIVDDSSAITDSLSVIPVKTGILHDKQDPRVKPEDDKATNKLLLIHLKMTGQLIWEANGEKKKHVLRRKRIAGGLVQGATLRVAGGHPSQAWGEELPCKHTRAIFKFDDDSELFFNDLRRFGYVKLVSLDQIDSIPETKKLGPEIDSAQFNTEYLKSRAIRMPRKKIKTFLMDQEVIAGIGNIYSDEALFYAKILPTRLAKDISDTEWVNLIKSVKKAIELGIKYGGSSEETFVNAFGEQGTMSDHSKVYRKAGQPCPICGTKISREKIGGRSAHFCPACQS